MWRIRGAKSAEPIVVVRDLRSGDQREGAGDLGLDLHGEVGVLKYGIEAAMTDVSNRWALRVSSTDGLQTA